MLLSAETARRQDEWSDALGHTVRALGRATKQAAKSYEDYRRALTHVGQLYAYCGELMASSSAPAFAMTENVAEADEAQAVSARVMSATERWMRSTEEQNCAAFFAAHEAAWQRWRQEVIRTQQHNKARKELQQLLDETNVKAERLCEKGRSTSRSVSSVEAELQQLREEVERYDNRVVRDMCTNVKLFSEALINNGGQLVDVMSASGYNAVCCFQTTGTVQTSRYRGATNAGKRSSCVVPSVETRGPSHSMSDECPLTSTVKEGGSIAQLATPRCASRTSTDAMAHYR